MKNRFFGAALKKAGKLITNPGRMMSLVFQVIARLRNFEKRKEIGKNLKDDLLTTVRLVSAYSRGHYRNVPVASLLKIVAAVVYFANPFDLVPDVLVGVGLVDDFAVLAWVFRSTQNEIEIFRQWELHTSAVVLEKETKPLVVAPRRSRVL